MTYTIPKNDRLAEVHVKEAKVRRFDTNANSAMPSVFVTPIVGSFCAFMFGVPLELIIPAGIAGATALLTGGTWVDLKRNTGDYIEMLSPKRVEPTKKELAKAALFSGRKETRRVVSTTFFDRNAGPVNALNSGLIYGYKRATTKEATHKVTNEIVSSWKGMRVVQTVEPLPSYLWTESMQGISQIYGVDVQGFTTKETHDLTKLYASGVSIETAIAEIEQMTEAPKALSK